MKVSLQHPQQFGTAVLSLTHKGLKWVTHSKPPALHFHQYSSCIKRKLVTKQSPLKSSFRFHTPSIYIRPCYGCVFYMLYCNLCGCVQEVKLFFLPVFLQILDLNTTVLQKWVKKKYFMHIFSLSVGLLIAPILTSIELPVTTYFNAD